MAHVTASAADPETAILRTHQRMDFRNCRRKWYWHGGLGRRLVPVLRPVSHTDYQSPDGETDEALGKELDSWGVTARDKHEEPERRPPAPALWFGSGMHYALEDYHGFNHWGHPATAFKAYANAYALSDDPIPDMWSELCDLGDGMMKYYVDEWLAHPDRFYQALTMSKYKTLWIDDVPQCEVEFEIELPINPRDLYGDATPYRRVVYQGTFDRVVIDEYDRLFIVDYKSAAQFESGHFMLDPQISAYFWAAKIIYGRTPSGFIYQQHRKRLPKPPKVLANGMVSVNAKMLTTAGLYETALRETYGTNRAVWPGVCVRYLGMLKEKEVSRQGAFIQVDVVERNEYQIESEYQKILMEAQEMLNPNLLLYPNPSRDCSRFCSLMTACISADDGSDVEFELASSLQPEREYVGWRQHLSLNPELLRLDPQTVRK